MRRIEWHTTIDSTMRRAAELADEGCEAGTIVAAEQQTAGVGRQGREWASAEGGLYFTVVLRPKLSVQELPMVTMALGLAVCDAVQLFGGVSCDLRWPNDVLVGDRKLAGILTQWRNGAVLAGIGVNVGQREFPAPLSAIATSLALETGSALESRALLSAIAASIDTHVRVLESRGTREILQLFSSASSYADGRRVTVDLPLGPVTGVTAGLTADGFLLVRKDDGEQIEVTAGGVRPHTEG